jgi:hypothetical protein
MRSACPARIGVFTAKRGDRCPGCARYRSVLLQTARTARQHIFSYRAWQACLVSSILDVAFEILWRTTNSKPSSTNFRNRTQAGSRDAQAHAPSSFPFAQRT